MKAIGAGLLLVALTGCTSMPPDYQRADTSKQQKEADAYQCELDSRKINGDACDQMSMYQKCMEIHGYTAIKGTGRSYCR
jgi:hypothetical protein